MEDPSFILKGPAARDMRELARGLQALVDTRSAAIAQPITVADISLPLSDALELAAESKLTAEDPPPSPGHRGGTGSTSIIPFLAKSLAAKQANHRG